MNDREKIQQFLDGVYLWLAASYGRPSGRPPPWPAIGIHARFAQLALEAWLEYLEGHPLDRLQRAVAQASQSDLQRYGLAGAQLSYKLAIIEFAGERAALGTPGWLRRLLELIDNLLESILKALNVDDALNEIKDALLGSLPDDE